MMEYFDLNLKACLINAWSVTDGIKNLITNAIRQYQDQTYFDSLIVQYDKNTSTLKISDQGTGINLNDFVQQTNAAKDNLANGLRFAISSLLASKIKIVFYSALGTFTPIIHNKEGISENIMDIFLTYEPKETKQPKWFSIKNRNATNNDDENQIKQGTEVIISPLDATFIKNLKFYFSFLLPWTNQIKTKAGYFLVPLNEHANNFFLNGENLTWFDERGDSHENHFAFSYDANSNYFDEDLIKNNKHRIWKFIPTCINAIYENLSENDQEWIFKNILNNDDCIEWKEPVIRKTIVQYYAKHHPNDYLLGVSDDEDEAFIAFAQKENKTIIWLADNDELDELKDLGIKTVIDFGKQYALDHYQHYVNIQDLSEQEANNWNHLQDFLYYFINHNEKIATILKKFNKESFNLKIVENLPSKWGLYLDDKDVEIIDQDSVKDLAKLIPSALHVTQLAISNEINMDEYLHLWIDSLTNFAFTKQEDKEEQVTKNN